MFQARFSAAVAGGEAASVRAEHTDEHQIAWAKLRQEAAHDRTVLRTDGQQLHQRPPSGGIRNVHRMVCAAFDQARTLRRIDIQHGKRSRPRLDSPYPRDQRSAGCGEEPSGTHLQREAAQRFRKGLYLRQDGFGARIRLRTGKAGPVADAKTAAKVMELTDRIVREGQLTTMMITHNMRDAIQYGNRLIMLHEGHIILDIAGEEKKNLTVPDLLEQFTKASGDEFANDRAILS